MKKSKVGIAAVAILLVVTGIGFGIAQAGGTHSERPVLSFADMEALDQSGSSGSYIDTSLENPIETGSLPESEGFGSIVVFGDDVERNLQEGVLAGGP